MNQIVSEAWKDRFNWDSWYKDVAEATKGINRHRVFIIEVHNNSVGYIWLNEEINSLWITAIVLQTKFQRLRIGQEIMKYYLLISMRLDKKIK